MLDGAEKAGFKRSNKIGIGVGLYRDYGSAQRLYVKRGYTPDGKVIKWLVTKFLFQRFYVLVIQKIMICACILNGNVEDLSSAIYQAGTLLANLQNCTFLCSGLFGQNLKVQDKLEQNFCIDFYMNIYEQSFLQGLQDSGIKLPNNWCITIHLLNLLSLLDCLVRSDPRNRPNQCKDIKELIGHILEKLEVQ